MAASETVRRLWYEGNIKFERVVEAEFHSREQGRDVVWTITAQDGDTIHLKEKGGSRTASIVGHWEGTNKERFDMVNNRYFSKRSDETIWEISKTQAEPPNYDLKFLNKIETDEEESKKLAKSGWCAHSECKVCHCKHCKCGVGLLVVGAAVAAIAAFYYMKKRNNA